MEISLTDQQRAAIAQHPGQPLTIDDDPTQTQYVLVRADQFRRLQQLAYDDSELTSEEMIAAAHDYDPRDAYPRVEQTMAEDDAHDPWLDSYE